LGDRLRSGGDAVDSEFVYWVGLQASERIAKIPLAGGDPLVLVSGGSWLR